MLAAALIEESNVKSYSIKINKDTKELINEITETFLKASENEYAIILFDDIDKFSEADGENAGTITFTFNPEIINGEKTGVLSINFSIDVNNSNRKFHIDSQTWIVIKNGQYFPLIGLYSYTGPKLKFSKYMNNIINEDIEAEYLVTKIVYNDDFNNKEQASYYKLKIENINN